MRKILLLFITTVVCSTLFAQTVVNEIDTIQSNLENKEFNLEEFVVVARNRGNYLSKLSTGKVEIISAAGLAKLACCNLAESFENSATVSTGYSDAISGAKQIRLLGLSGRYTQMLDESRPDMRGLSQPFGLSYTPGQWLESIQIAKGAGSVLQGYENITGQINLEFRKPTTPLPLFLNLYVDQFARTELNAAATRQLSDSWDTGLLAHVSVDPLKQDENGDGFLDEPAKRQFNLANRWIYRSDNGMQLRFGVKGVYEKREGGQMDFRRNQERDIFHPYGTEIENTHINSYVKLAFPLNEKSNLAFVGDYTFHELNSFFGLKDYNGHQNTATLNVLLQSTLSEQHSYTVGASGRWDDYREFLDDGWVEGSGLKITIYGRGVGLNRTEKTVDVFGEYTFTLEDKLTVVAGARVDYYNQDGIAGQARNDKSQWLFTPRATLKYNFTDDLILRASTGSGFRTANPISDNTGILATGRPIVIAPDLDLEKAWTSGSSLSWSFPLGVDKATLSADYYYTNFSNQVLVDQEFGYNIDSFNKAPINIFNLNGKSYSHTYQIDFSVEPFERFTALATFRYTDAKATYLDNQLREIPLTDRYKGVFNLQYATRMSRWTFDVTAQLNGQTRLPDFAVTDGKKKSSAYPLFFGQITRKFKGLAIYAGVENLLNYTQKNPIISAANPYSPEFNSSVIWGPLMGRRIYAGLRWEIF